MKIVLIGYYGFGNFGDEWLCRQSQQFITDQFPGCNFKIAVDSPTQSHHIFRRSIIAMIRGIQWSDYVLFGGGGIFQTQTSQRNIWYYMMIMVVALFFNRRYLLIGQSIGNISNPFTRYILSVLLSKALLFSVRDGVQSLSQTKMVTADLCYYHAIMSHQVSQEAPMAICFRHQWMTAPLRLLYQQFDGDIHLLCQSGQDIEGRIQYVLPDCDVPLSLVISMRYHACVWASQRGIPFIAIGDDTKLVAIARACGQQWVGLTHIHTILDCIDDVRHRWSYYHHQLCDRVPKMCHSFNPLQTALKCALDTV